MPFDPNNLHDLQFSIASHMGPLPHGQMDVRCLLFHRFSDKVAPIGTITHGYRLAIPDISAHFQ